MPRFDPRPASLALLEAFRDGEPISALPAGSEPATSAQGSQIARAVVEGLGLPVVGFRALADGTTGPLLEPRIARSGVTIPLAALPGIEASAACFFPLVRALPPAVEPYTARRVLAALGPARAAIDLSAWRTQSRPDTVARRIADLAGLGMVVLAGAPRGAAHADPRTLRVSWNDGTMVEADASPQLLAAAEAARRAGGLPVGAALVAAGLLPGIAPQPGSRLSLRLVGGGRVSATLA
jgi:hypothetical protein